MTKEERKQFDDFGKDLDKKINEINEKTDGIFKMVCTFEEFWTEKGLLIDDNIVEINNKMDVMFERFEDISTINQTVDIPEKVVKKQIRKGTKDAIKDGYMYDLHKDMMQLHYEIDEIKQQIAVLAELVKNQ